MTFGENVSGLFVIIFIVLFIHGTILVNGFEVKRFAYDKPPSPAVYMYQIGEELRRYKRGLSNKDPSNRATDMPTSTTSTTTTIPPSPASSNFETTLTTKSVDTTTTAAAVTTNIATTTQTTANSWKNKLSSVTTAIEKLKNKVKGAMQNVLKLIP